MTTQFANGYIRPKPDIVTDHTRSGNMQILSGVDNTGSVLDIESAFTVDTFESIGPTGSGATNIWTALDDLPSNASILIARTYISAVTSGASNAYVRFFAIYGDESPAPGFSDQDTEGNQIVEVGVDANAASFRFTHAAEFAIPLGADNDFFLMYSVSNINASETINLYYKGFITDD